MKFFNDLNDTKILNEVFAERFDILISEDKKIHKKAELLGIKNKVFKIQQFSDVFRFSFVGTELKDANIKNMVLKIL